MGRWAREEIETAFDHFQQAALLGGTTGDWREWANCFTEDVTYVERHYGVFGGREAVFNWISTIMKEKPNDEMDYFPINWYVIDEERGWVICEVMNRMKDPGDGSLHEAPNITILHYAGNNKWSYEEDVYNPRDMGVMIKKWMATKEKCKSGSASKK